MMHRDVTISGLEVPYVLIVLIRQIMMVRYITVMYTMTITPIGGQTDE